MKKSCPNPHCECPELFIKDGKFKRLEDSKFIQRYRCKNCGTRFSSATFTPTYRQKKRRVNSELLKLFASNLSQRRAAILLGVSRKTIERKFPLVAIRARKLNDRFLQKLKGRVFNAQIDDLITKENSKLKPLSVSIAVDEDRRFILGAEVSQIPAFGHLSKLAIKKYGERKDEHFNGLTRLFKKLHPILNPEVIFKSDEHQRYPGFIYGYFPRGHHLTFKSERGCVAGQGELKKVQFDPLFIVNHTCALLRANINRLIRKTWCTTKDPRRLKDHLDIFIYFYNQVLLQGSLTPI
jgi:transposase-like protein